MEEQRFFAWRALTKTLSQMGASVTSSATIATADGASPQLSPVCHRTSSRCSERGPCWAVPSSSATRGLIPAWPS